MASREEQAGCWWGDVEIDLKHKLWTCVWGERSTPATFRYYSDPSSHSSRSIDSELRNSYIQFSQLFDLQLSHMLFLALDVLLLDFHFFFSLNKHIHTFPYSCFSRLSAFFRYPFNPPSIRLFLSFRLFWASITFLIYSSSVFRCLWCSLILSWLLMVRLFYCLFSFGCSFFCWRVSLISLLRRWLFLMLLTIFFRSRYSSCRRFCSFWGLTYSDISMI